MEKAGILRTGCAAVCGDINPPQSVINHAAKSAVKLKLIGHDFRVEPQAETWAVRANDGSLDELPLPALAGEFQLANAATAIMALKSLHDLTTSVGAIKQGLRDVRLPGRFQIIWQRPVVIVDVAHNLQAAESLASQLKAHDCAGRTRAIVAMLADKPVTDVIKAVSGEIDDWYPAGLESVPRGLSAAHMADAVERLTSDVKLSAASTVASACEQALAAAADNDRIIIFGSFYTVAQAMHFFALQSL